MAAGVARDDDHQLDAVDGAETRVMGCQRIQLVRALYGKLNGRVDRSGTRAIRSASLVLSLEILYDFASLLGAMMFTLYEFIPRCHKAHNAVLYSASAVVICPRWLSFVER